MKKFILLFVVITTLALAGCKTTKGTDSTATTADTAGTTAGTTAPVSNYDVLPYNTVGDVTVMLWSGDDIFYEDLGSQEWDPNTITGQNTATIYAVAKEFKKIYPNIKINVYAISGDPGKDGTSWFQKRQVFQSTEGHWPDIYATVDLVDDVQLGMVSDLSVFNEDPLYQSFNTSIMGMMNYYGFQAGLPQYLVPDSIYINRELATSKNIISPEPDWTIDEYTRFIKRGDNTTYWGAMDANPGIINTGTTTIDYQLKNYSGTGDYVNINSEEVRTLLDEYFADWAANSIWPQWDGGLLDQAFVEGELGWSGYTAFRTNKLLTYDGEIWNMGNAAHSNPDHSLRVQSEDWDLYPYPSTDYRGNTVAVRLDPIAIHNFAMNDLDPDMSDAEFLELKTAYTFAAFWMGDTRSMQARADQQYYSNGVLSTSMNDSLPLVTGVEFDKQMQIWYSTDTHQRYADTELMPGFAYILELWEDGELWNVTDKIYPMKHNDETGARVVNLYEWSQLNKNEIVGKERVEADFVDSILAQLGDWNIEANEHFALAFEQLKDGLKEHYGYTDADFE
ncbi:MAG: hypothetical protein K0Q49_488 [Haloplasmataceae bacterium]|nr:hypothetical protein [Haloplasmataceae bacterium]